MGLILSSLPASHVLELRSAGLKTSGAGTSLLEVRAAGALGGKAC